MSLYRGFASTPQLVAQVTANIASVPAATAPIIDFTVPGAQPGMFFLVAAPSLETGLALGDAFCSTAGTVRVRVINPTIAAVDAASQVYYFIGL